MWGIKTVTRLAALSVAVALAGCDGSDRHTDAPVQEAAGRAPDIDLTYEKFTLDNGLRVIVHEDRKAPIVAVSVWYHVGSKDEPAGKTGFAHLFEHLMFNGSENYDDEFFKPLEQVGATGRNGTTSFDRTNYFENVPTPALDLALWLESDRMGHLLGAVTQEKLDEQRGVVQNEKRQNYDNQPYGTAFKHIVEGLFPSDHPYSHLPIGSLEDLDAASLEDVKAWFRKYYGPNNSVLVLAGDIDAATAREKVETYFGDIPPGPPLERYEDWVPERNVNTYQVVEDKVPQTRIYRIWAAPERTARETKLLRLAADVLGDGKNSRLYRTLAYDRQLATSASTFLLENELASALGVFVDVAEGADRREVERLIDQEVAKFLEEGPTAEELGRAVTKINADVIRGLEQVGGFGGKAVTLASGEIYAGDPDYIETELEWYNSATPADVREAARDWLADGFHQVTFVPFGDYSASAEGADRSQLPEVPDDLPELSFPEIRTAELSNGMKVVLAQRDAVPIVNVAIQFDAGYAADHGGKLGRSGFAMDMMDEGTAAMTALELSAELERLGANLNTGSTLDTSTVRLNALKANLGASVELMADVVRNPAFSQEEIDRKKPQWIARIRQEQVQPVGLALRQLPPLLYGRDHAYGIPYTGSGDVASIQSLERGDLVDFHRNWLRPDNATLFVVGDATLEEITPVLEAAFGEWAAPEGPRPEKTLATVEQPDAPRVFIVNRPGSPQSLILGGHLVTPSGDERDIAIDAMNAVLGGSFTSRINMNVREDKGWAYGAQTLLLDAEAQRPYLVFAPVQADRTGDSLREILKEIEAYRTDEPPTPQEMERAINNATLSLPGRFETAGAVLGELLESERFGRSYDYVETITDTYRALTPEQLQTVARDIIKPQAMTWLIVGDAESVRSQLEGMSFASIEVLPMGGGN